MSRKEKRFEHKKHISMWLSGETYALSGEKQVQCAIKIVQNICKTGGTIRQLGMKTQ
jgi:hypothetical protein